LGETLTLSLLRRWRSTLETGRKLSSPKPSIFLNPSGGHPGGATTVQYQGQCRGLEFALYKAGARNAAAWGRDSAGVKFPIPKVSRAEEGSYTCYYPPDTWSEPRDPMELVVGSEGLPRPSISLSPSGVTAPGADVTIQCQGPRWDVRFFLHKAGDLNPQQHMDRTGAGAEFRIPTVGRQHGGSYSCSYRPQSEPFVCSQPSNTVELVVAGERPSSVSPLPARPSEVCRGLSQGVLLRLPPHWEHTEESGPRGCRAGTGPSHKPPSPD
uniref:Ig-like domain-containing protein n=1 Tax=Gopherus agassizii TaxID=38772 RepID=A0A452GW34_9SAUR